MAKTKNEKFTYAYLEKWDTRFGQSERVVIRRQDGTFYDNVSLTALKKAPTAPNTRKG